MKKDFKTEAVGLLTEGVVLLIFIAIVFMAYRIEAF